MAISQKLKRQFIIKITCIILCLMVLNGIKISETKKSIIKFTTDTNDISHGIETPNEHVITFIFGLTLSIFFLSWNVSNPKKVYLIVY